MKKVNIVNKTTLTLRGIKCFLEREVKPFGTSGRIDFPKEFIGKKVFVIVADE
jgi:putative transposon-encoded protein